MEASLQHAPQLKPAVFTFFVSREGVPMILFLEARASSRRMTAAWWRRARACLRRGPRTVSNAHVFLLASLFFLTPNAVFAISLEPLPAAMVIAGCLAIVAGLWPARQAALQLAAPVGARQFALCVAGGLALCLLGGEGHFFYSPSDWLVRDAVLADLVRDGPKALYQIDGQIYLLRAPLGMYLAPAAAGRLLGLPAAHLALLGQNAVIFGSILYLASLLAETRKVAFLLLMALSSGLDVLGAGLAEAIEAARTGAFFAVLDIEWWPKYFFAHPLQYSSFVTQLFWAPNHLAPGVWVALLVLLHARGEIGFATLLLSCAPLFLWSPLAVMGAAPFVGFFALRAPARRLDAARSVLVAAAIVGFSPVALYLLLDSGAVPSEWLILRQGFIGIYFIFILFEIPQAAVVLYAWRRTDAVDRGPLLLALALLLVIPLYSLGQFNDFAMRASIPALFLLAFSFARVAVSTPRDGGVLPTTIAALVLLGATTPTLRVVEALKGSYAVSDCNLATAWSKIAPTPLLTNYWARIEKVPGWMISLDAAPAPLTVEARKCWPDHRLRPDDRD